MEDQSQQTTVVNFEIGIGEGRFSASAVVPLGPTNLTQILPVLQELDNIFVDGIAKQWCASGRAVRCKAGCGACCRQLVPISIFEAEMLADWIRTLPAERQQELANRFHQGLLKLAAGGIIDQLVNQDWFSEQESARALALDYIRQGVPCPFLEDESCSIHPFRPLVCREYLVTSSPEFCAHPTKETVDAIPMPIHFSRVLQQIGGNLEADKRGGIPLIFLFAWMKSNSRPGEAVSGTGPQVLYEFLRGVAEAHGSAATAPKDCS